MLPSKKQRVHNRQHNSESSSSSSSSFEQLLPFVESVTSDIGLRRALVECVYPDDDIDGTMQRFRDRPPGALPYSMSRTSLNLLKTTPHLVCEKSDGERALMYIGEEGAFYVDRKFNFYKLKRSEDYRACMAIEGSTLLDGELVPQIGPASQETALGHAYAYMCFDVVAVAGKPVGGLPLTGRLAQMGTLIDSIKDKTLPLPIRKKRFYQKKDVKELFSKINKEHVYFDQKRGICNKNDGLIFTPINDDYLCSKNPAGLLKWKWPGMNTVDFKVIPPYFNSRGEVNLYCGGPKNADLFLRSVLLEEDARREFLELVDGRTAIVECAFNHVNGIWEVKGARTDKKSANYVVTVMGTLETVVDNVHKEELESVCTHAKH